MQLIKKCTIACIAVQAVCIVFAQDLQEDDLSKPASDKTTVQFLISYYEQDGNHSPVTGGVGTEKLDDITPRIVINVPLKNNQTINLLGGVDIYTSASTDMIDDRMSSASKRDSRGYGSLTYSKEFPDNHFKIGGMLGGSVEYDYTSLSGGLLFSKWSKDNNRQVDLTASAFIDQWKTYYPHDVPREQHFTNKSRNTFNFTSSVSQVVNKDFQISFSADVVYQQGLLSTPFHRVYFENENTPRLEKLPDGRLKIPVGIKANYYLNDLLVLRLGYRYYWDDWNLTAHSIETELPVKFGRFFTVYPFYRYHTQTSADYFAPINQHTTGTEFFTSDYDLSDLTSNKYGLGIRWSPLNGVGRMKRWNLGTILFKDINVRYARFDRSDGLNANIVSLGLGFEF